MTTSQSVKEYGTTAVGNQQKTVLRHAAMGVKNSKIADLFISVGNNE